MNYLVRYQFAPKNPAPFKSQADIITSNLAPLVEEKSFQRGKSNFYITKVNYTNVRLVVFTTHEYLNDIKRVVEFYTASLILPNDNWGGNEIEGGTAGSQAYYESHAEELDFRNYLENITKIGLDLHKEDLALAVPFALQARFEAQPIKPLHPQVILESHFRELSEHYRSLEANPDELNRFWKHFCYRYRRTATPWNHFYCNIVLGIDAFSCHQLLNRVMYDLKKDFNITTKLPTGISCRRQLVLLINDLLKRPL